MCVGWLQFLASLVAFISILSFWYLYVLKCQATSLYIRCVVGTKSIPKRQPWAEAICLLMCLLVVLMHTKPGSFQGFTPILSAAQLCKYARKVLTDIANSNVSSLCVVLARKGRQNLRIATPWSNGKWREESICPFLWKLGSAYLCFLFPGSETKGPSSSQMASKTSLLLNSSDGPGIWQHFSIVGEWGKRNRKTERGSLKNLHCKFTWSLSVILLDLCLNSHLIYSLLSWWIILMPVWHDVCIGFKLGVSFACSSYGTSV